MSFESCHEKDEDGETCGEPSNSTLEILKEVKKVYEGRLKRIDEEACGDGTQLKLRTLRSWITDLEDQNASLVHVVEQLERAAAERLHAAQHTNISSSGRDEEIEELKAEINNLNMKLSQYRENENNQRSEILLLRDEVMAITEDNKLKENQIQGFIKRIQNLIADIENRTEEEISIFSGSNKGIDTMVEQCYTVLQISLRNALNERNMFAKEIQRCTEEIQQYRITINEQENERKNMYENVNREICEKQNHIFIMHRDIHLLEEKLEQLEITSQFKDDIIKEMRKELKLARVKGMEYKEIIEHLKNKLIMRDITIKQQEKSMNMLQESLTKCDNRLEDLRIKSKETELQLQDVKLRLIKHVSNTFNESIKYYQNPCEYNNWMNIIEQMKELAVTFKERGTKVIDQESKFNSIAEKIKKSQLDVRMLKQKFSLYLEDIQTVGQNEADSERRIVELKEILTKSYTDIQESLRSSCSDSSMTCTLYVRNIQSLTEKAEESQVTFRNLKAEINYLSFCMKSRERQAKYLENMVISLSDLIEGTYSNIEEMTNTTKIYRKEKEIFHKNQEQCQQRIERLEKALKTLQEETMNSQRISPPQAESVTHPEGNG